MLKLFWKRIVSFFISLNNISNQFGVLITTVVATMYCAYFFAFLAFQGLHTALQPGGGGLVQWISQEFLQLVLLSVIMVGQDVISKKQAAAEKTAKTRSEATERAARERLDTAIDSIMVQFELNQNELQELKSTHAELHSLHSEMLETQTKILNRLEAKEE